jgi:hypothetical protein
MEKEFIPYEQALALKELGFDEPCLRGWSDVKQIWYHPDSDIVLDNPTFSQAFRWFREKYNLSFYIWRKEELFKIVLQRPNQNSYFFNDEFNTYEEAELACLKKLIEIVK